MSVDQTNVIDIVSKNGKGEIVLTISDHLDWKNVHEHLVLLQEKINTYLTFLRSGEIYRKYPDARKRQIAIEVMFHYAPHPAADPLLSNVKSTVEEAGYGFRHALFAATPFKV